ncbi:MAG: cob(I)yrinic acid a,c-diamide adenosyltransferase [Gammaproteobacteria bacterium]
MRRNNRSQARSEDNAPDRTAYLRRAEKRRAGYDKKQACATQEKGLLIVNTGTGKGKTTAAFGMVLRALGHGMKVGILQFIKGARPSAEREVLARFAGVDFKTMGDGFTWITQDRDQDVATAWKAWAEAKRMIADPSYAMVILDEFNVILRYQYLPLEEVLDTLCSRRPMLHVVVTGRHAPAKLIAAADLVSEIRPIKHPYREQGVKAQPGIEF